MGSGTWETATDFCKKYGVVPVRFCFDLWMLIVCGHANFFYPILLVWSVKLNICQVYQPGVQVDSEAVDEIQ